MMLACEGTQCFAEALRLVGFTKSPWNAGNMIRADSKPECALPSWSHCRFEARSGELRSLHWQEVTIGRIE